MKDLAFDHLMLFERVAALGSLSGVARERDVPVSQVARQIGELGRALYAAPSYLQAAGIPSHPDDLANHRLVTNTVATYFNDWPFLIEGQRVKLPMQGFWRCNDTGVATTMALQGLGIARLATLVALPLVAQKRLVPVLAAFVEPMPVPIFAVTATRRQRLPKIKACIDYWAQWFNTASTA